MSNHIVECGTTSGYAAHIAADSEPCARCTRAAQVKLQLAEEIRLKGLCDSNQMMRDSFQFGKGFAR